MHVDEAKLELYVVDPERLSVEERNYIHAHLKDCRWCTENYEQIAAVYANFDEEQTKHLETGRQPTLESRLPMVQKIYGDSIQLATERAPASFVATVTTYMRDHPFASGAATVFALLLLLAVWQRDNLFTHRNPTNALAKDGFLMVYDQRGELMWSHFIHQSYSFPDIPGWGDPTSYLTVYDVDGDGENEVIALMGWNVLLPMGNTILCFKPDGHIRWKHEVHRNISLGGRTYSDDYRVANMLVGDFDHDGRGDLVAVAKHVPWEPSILLLIDIATGEVRGEYLNPGHVLQLLHVDINEDGVEGILAAGQNNAYDLISVIVFDPRFIKGQAPSPSRYWSKDLPAGIEKYFIILPKSDFQKVSGSLKPSPIDMRLTGQGTFTVTSSEKIGDAPCDLIFEFDRGMQCGGVRAADNFLGMHQKLEREGVFTGPVDENYLKKLQESVQYWDGEKFVKEAVMNRNYLEAIRLAQK